MIIKKETKKVLGLLNVGAAAEVPAIPGISIPLATMVKSMAWALTSGNPLLPVLLYIPQKLHKPKKIAIKVQFLCSDFFVLGRKGGNICKKHNFKEKKNIGGVSTKP